MNSSLMTLVWTITAKVKKSRIATLLKKLIREW